MLSERKRSFSQFASWQSYILFPTTLVLPNSPSPSTLNPLLPPGAPHHLSLRYQGTIIITCALRCFPRIQIRKIYSWTKSGENPAAWGRSEAVEQGDKMRQEQGRTLFCDSVAGELLPGWCREAIGSEKHWQDSRGKLPPIHATPTWRPGWPHVPERRFCFVAPRRWCCCDNRAKLSTKKTFLIFI